MEAARSMCSGQLNPAGFPLDTADVLRLVLHYRVIQDGESRLVSA
jgi:hypothetical protein